MAADSPRRRKRRHTDAGEPLLVEAKLATPSAPRGLVGRPRVQQALDAGRHAALTLVAAPAGFGKTTAVRAWCSSQEAALAWVTLDAADNDPALLWRYIATAVDRVRPGLGRGALRRLAVPGAPVEDAVDELANGIAALERDLVVVLDDLHTVTSEESLSSLDHALAHFPATAHMVAVTRMDPALRLASYRANGRLVEVRADELAFTRDEAHELLVTQGHVELGPEELDVLVERTEGWPAALVLAGLWLGTVDDPVRAVRGFGGEHRFVAEYLSNEVLVSLDPVRRSFLHGVAVLGEFTADLCDVVLERSDSAAELAELERSNLFVSRLGRGGWFRVHSLFAEYALAQLATSEPAAAARIHRRAAEWLRSHRLPIEAVRHAAAVGDHELVAQLLVENHLLLIRSGAGRTLARWIRTLPDDVVADHPELAVAAATATALSGGSTLEQRRLLALADRALRERPGRVDPYVETAALLVRALTVEGGAGRAVLDGRRAIELAEGGADEILTAALAACARALFFAGDLEEASAVALRALEHPDIEQRVPSLVVARSTYALVAVEHGRLDTARSHAEKAKAAVGEIGTSRSWLGANASVALGSVLAAEGILVEAERELASAEPFFRDEVATLHHTWLLVLLAHVRTHRGRLDEAEEALRSARAALGELTDGGFVPALADDVERELEIAKARARTGEVLESPSAAELAVLRLLVTDLSTREIGERLFLSPNTIRSHRHSLYRKLGVHSRADAIARAGTLGLLDETESPG
jgi:LuxR family maltose regulon positive regulatory protein